MGKMPADTGLATIVVSFKLGFRILHGLKWKLKVKQTKMFTLAWMKHEHVVWKCGVKILVSIRPLYNHSSALSCFFFFQFLAFSPYFNLNALLIAFQKIIRLQEKKSGFQIIILIMMPRKLVMAKVQCELLRSNEISNPSITVYFLKLHLSTFHQSSLNWSPICLVQ